MKKIVFTDWWDDFNIHDNFITQALNGKVEYCVEDATNVALNREEVDFVFCSSFGKDALSFKCPRIFFTGENEIPDFNIYDYGIGFDELTYGDRYIRFPLYAACYLADCEKMMHKNDNLCIKTSVKRDFCSIVISNGTNAEPYREELFEALTEYKFVASGGRYRNNINKPEGVEDKLQFLKKYKFNIACENVSHPGYCTEKIVQAFASGTVPIYWGDPNVSRYFNPKAFINCNEYDSVSDVLKVVKALDENDEKYQLMLREPAVINEEYRIETLQKDFRKWLIRIVGQDKSVAYRRSLFGRAAIYENSIIDREVAFVREIQLRDISLLRFIIYKIKQKMRIFCKK